MSSLNPYADDAYYDDEYEEEYDYEEEDEEDEEIPVIPGLKEAGLVIKRPEREHGGTSLTSALLDQLTYLRTTSPDYNPNRPQRESPITAWGIYNAIQHALKKNGHAMQRPDSFLPKDCHEQIEIFVNMFDHNVKVLGAEGELFFTTSNSDGDSSSSSQGDERQDDYEMEDSTPKTIIIVHLGGERYASTRDPYLELWAQELAQKKAAALRLGLQRTRAWSTAKKRSLEEMDTNSLLGKRKLGSGSAGDLGAEMKEDGQDEESQPKKKKKTRKVADGVKQEDVDGNAEENQPEKKKARRVARSIKKERED